MIKKSNEKRVLNTCLPLPNIKEMVCKGMTSCMRLVVRFSGRLRLLRTSFGKYSLHMKGIWIGVNWRREECDECVGVACNREEKKRREGPTKSVN